MDLDLIARAVVVREGAVLLVQEVAAGYSVFPGGHVRPRALADLVVAALR